jgi:hypothetical protein
MYGLKQAARLAFDNLVKLLEPNGYYPICASPGLWKHTTRPTLFTLCVDDFGIKYTSNEDATHLLNAIGQNYKYSVDRTGNNYLGLVLNWNYKDKWIENSMPTYIAKALHKFQHTPPTKPQDPPHDHTEPVYGQKVQLANKDNSPSLNASGTKRVQEVSGTLLYYARTVDPTMLCALNEITMAQSAPTEATAQKCTHILDYAATHPVAKIRYYASDMILKADTDAAYLVLPKARSRVAGHYYLSNLQSDYGKGDPQKNGPILTIVQSLKNVVSSAAEAETGGVFINAQVIIPTRTTLIDMGHPQPTTGTPLVTDNSTSHGILKNLIKPKKSKTWDMHYHWVEDRIQQGQIDLIWKPGTSNWADYFTKHHPPAYHRLMRYKYLANLLVTIRKTQTPLTNRVRGCVTNLDGQSYHVRPKPYGRQTYDRYESGMHSNRRSSVHSH